MLMELRTHCTGRTDTVIIDLKKKIPGASSSVLGTWKSLTNCLLNSEMNKSNLEENPIIGNLPCSKKILAIFN